MTMRTFAPERLSDLIGRIYDCAIEPERWPDTLAEICRSLNCMSGMILLIDLEHGGYKFAYTWGISSDWPRHILQHADLFTGFYRHLRHLRPDGEPLVLSHYIDAVGPRGQQFYGALTQPHGISDMLQAVVLREARRLAVFGANR